MRYISTEGYTVPVYHVEPDLKKSKELSLKAKDALEVEASNGIGEAMRMLAYTYFGHWGPYHDKDFSQAEHWLLQAYEAGCYAASNDLSTFYVAQDIAKAKFWYAKANEHNCRVIYHPECEA